eukprot:111293-Ditylum_brightwellii.AAC.1
MDNTGNKYKSHKKKHKPKLKCANEATEKMKEEFIKVIGLRGDFPPVFHANNVDFITCCIKQHSMKVSEVNAALQSIFNVEVVGMVKTGAIVSSDVEVQKLHSLLKESSGTNAT